MRDIPLLTLTHKYLVKDGAYEHLLLQLPTLLD